MKRKIVAYKPLPRLLLFAIVQDQLWFAGDGSRPDAQALSTDGGAILFGRRGDWLQLSLDGTIGIAHAPSRLLGALETGRLLVGRVGLFLAGGTQLAGQRAVDYFVDAGLRYLFRLDAPAR